MKRKVVLFLALILMLGNSVPVKAQDDSLGFIKFFLSVAMVTTGQVFYLLFYSASYDMVNNWAHGLNRLGRVTDFLRLTELTSPNQQGRNRIAKITTFRIMYSAVLALVLVGFMKTISALFGDDDYDDKIIITKKLVKGKNNKKGKYIKDAVYREIDCED
ncbi:MAG: hypothetical protein LBL71_03595 [Endomicrobium sp.]|jgi:hypothetical protein|nr:hypothetical protein [Endomicrobium sp.]